jgi:hypothetical protein
MVARKKSAKKKTAARAVKSSPAPVIDPRGVMVTNIGTRTVFTDRGWLRPGESEYCDPGVAKVLCARGFCDVFAN